MKKILILLVCFLLSCYNRDKEVRKAADKARLCILLLGKQDIENNRSSLLSSVYCTTLLYKKILKIDSQNYFESDDH